MAPKRAGRYAQLIEAIFFNYYEEGDTEVHFSRFMRDDLIALFAFEDSEQSLAITAERHYRLVAPADLSSAELAVYQSRPL